MSAKRQGIAREEGHLNGLFSLLSFLPEMKGVVLDVCYSILVPCLESSSLHRDAIWSLPDISSGSIWTLVNAQQ